MSSSDLSEVEIVPGLFTEKSDRSSRGRWVDGNRVRFFNGLPEKMGGWVKVFEFTDITGVVRNMLSWSMLNNQALVVFGAHTGIWLLTNDVLTNITPARLATDGFGGAEADLTNPFAFTDGSNVIPVSHTSHGAILGDYVEFSGSVNTAGVPNGEINTVHEITKITNANLYEITVTTEATATQSDGGTVDYAYDINTGQLNTVTGKGFGLGGFGTDREGWNTELNYDVDPGDAKVVVPARTWSLVAWGEDLIASPRRGEVYVYDSSAAGRATLITEVPGSCEQVIMSTANQQLFALGCIPTGGSVPDPMYLRWCDSRDYAVWTASAVNAAGGFRLDQGNFIVGGLQIGTILLVFTDLGCYRIFPAPSPVYYGKQYLGKTSILGPNAGTEYQGIAYWMGTNNFYTYTSSTNVLPCDVHSHVFHDINLSQQDKVVSGTNHRFNEIFWFYPSADSTEVDRYVTYNTQEKTWAFGVIDRTAWRDNEFRFDSPYAADAAGNIYQHEVGYTADGQQMGEYLTSYAFDIRLKGASDTREVLKIDTWVPDFETLDSAIQLEVSKRKWPHGPMYDVGPFEVRADTKMVKKKVRGRQIKLRLSGQGGGFWRMAPFRIGGYPDGHR